MCKRSVCVSLLAVFLVTAPVSADLIGWWKFDDGTGTAAVDSSGKGQNGVLTNDPVWSAAGKYGGCVQFDGTNDYVVATGSWPMPQYTVSVWFREDRATGDQRDIISIEGAGNTSGVLLEIGTDGRVRFLHRAPLGTTGGPSIYSVAAASAAAWHHIAAIKSDTQMILYVDGQSVASQADTTVFDQPPTFVYIGILDTRMMRPWPGLIDDLKIFNTALSEADVRSAMANAITGTASQPSPSNQATDVPRDVVLAWKPGATTVARDVYLGTTFADVNAASRTAPNGLLVSKAQDPNTFDPPGLLQYGQTYYWRVDEVNDAAGSQIFRGTTWSFTVEPLLYPVTGVTATASSFTTGAGPQNTVNGSGLNAADLHGTENNTMWVTAKGTTLPAWIQYDLGRICKLESMLVWNYNAMFEDLIGIGAKGVKVEYSTDAANWTALADVTQFAQGPGADDYAANNTVNFGGVPARYVKITITSTWGATQTGLSEVRFLQMIDYARSPQPATGATGVSPSVTLSWRPGRQAASNKVYLGTDANAVTNGTAAAQSMADKSYAPAGLLLGTTYYWKVDEVNTAEAISTWAGDLWSFTTADYVVVDDMEGYTDDEPKRIFDAWVDGYGTTTNGSVVGNNTAPFAEKTIIHGGAQSMPFAYNNTSATNSEATRTFGQAQDWTIGGVKTLVVYFRGDPANTTGQLFVKINATKVNYPGNAAAEASIIWTQWNIDLTAISGLKAVNTLTIGVSGAGKGTLYLDDIRLYKSAPAVVTPADPGTTGLVAYYAMENDAKDSKGTYNGTLNNITFADSFAGLGKAAQFNGTNGYIDLGASFGDLIGTLSSCTIGAWVNYTGTGNVWQRVIDCGNGGATPQVYLMLTTRNAGNNPRFAYTRTSTAGEVIATAPLTLSVGWHHLAAVVDATTMTAALYVDGNLGQGNVAATFLPKDLGKTTQNWLGRSQWSADPYLNGALDELRIFNRALSAGEVLYLAGGR